MPAQTRHRASGEHSSPKKRLTFREKLFQKGSSTDALLKRLKALHTELAEMDQEQVDTSSLSTVRKDLISTSIFLHKDRGVKAYAACCLADILRLYAPDAPYTQAELRDIFQFFFRQLATGMKSQESPYYSEYFHLLESLSTVKSVVLVCDLPNAEELMTDIVKQFFALVRNNFAKKIEIFMAEILVAIIDEAQSVPSDALDLILAQFMDKNAKIEQPAYRLAVQVCNQTSDKLQRHVALYFSEIIIAHGDEEDKDDLSAAHTLIKRLHASCPDLLQSVIPQLEEELHMESVTMRGFATDTLGEMFGDKNGPELYKNFSSTWTAWLSRCNDKSSVIRLKFVESSKGLYSTTMLEMREAFETMLGRKLMDPDEKVRAAVCKLYSELDYETASHHVSSQQLKAVIARVADRKGIVRQAAATSVARLYSLAHPEIENNDATAIEKFSWIPGELLNNLKLTECRPAIEQAFYEHILPLPASTSGPSTSNAKGTNVEVDEVAWTNRLLSTILYLPEKSMTQLLSLANLRNARPTSYEAYVNACVQNNGGVIDENEELVKKRLEGMIRVVSSSFPDPSKAAEDLRAFASLNESRLYKLLKTCMDVQTDLKGLIKASQDFTRRLEQASSSLVPTFTIFLRRATLRIINSSSIPTLLKTAQHGKSMARRGTITKTNQSAAHAQLLLTWMSKWCPALFKAHVDALVSVIQDNSNEKSVTVALQALAEVARCDASVAPREQETLEQIQEFALGSNYRHSKFAARFLAFCEDKDQQCMKLAETIADSLEDVPSDQMVAHITVLDQLVRFNPDSFEHKSDVITVFLLKNLLMVSDPAPEDEDENSEEWVPNEELPDTTRAKIMALKVFRHRSLAHASSSKAIELSTPVLKLLAALLDKDGALVLDEPQARTVLSRMRLQAAVSLLHLSTVEAYAGALQPKFLRLALVVQDPCFEVRLTFVNKCLNLLVNGKLSERFNIVPFMTAHDPEDEIKLYARSYVLAQLKRLPPAARVKQFDLVFIRLLHALAHHPDFGRTQQVALIDMAKYIMFYVNLVANEETISLLFHLAMKGKTVQDSESEEYSENFYVLCDMAQELLKARAQQQSWNITSYPGKVKLPGDILRPHSNAEAANQVVKRSYLSDQAIAWVTEVAEPPKEKRERKAPKRKAPATTNGQTKRSRKKKRQSAATDDDGDDGLTDPATSDVDMTDPPVEAHASEPEAEEEPSDGEEKLGRGARSRAKAKAKRQAAKKKVAKPDTHDSE
ncbi:Sister chromatid cohesion protein pds5 [Marasmius crinis-equi]|uniref:Sister chromatid cohesion protein pds5 n=1 Tax=Marasmius crinis-equi TaxID=585013 RepID=A0ABR3FFI5_9AGAR